MACYDTIHLEKGMYAVPGKSFTEVLEELDGSAQYAGTPLEGLDAYQRQLKRFDIRVNGRGADRLEKFFRSSTSAALFPEYVARAVRQGMESNDRLADIVATVTSIDALDYRSIGVSATKDQHGLETPDAETGLPVSAIETRKGLVNLKKRGRVLTASYEALRFYKLDVLTVLLRQIGAMIAEQQTKDAVDVLLAGDGVNTPDAATELSSDMTYGDLVSLWGKLSPYRMTTMLAGTRAIEQMLSFNELKDAAAGNAFHGTGKLATPLGATLIHVPQMEDGQVVALDRSCALEMIEAGGLLTDYDKLIDKQLERAAITTVTGFSFLFPKAVQIVKKAGE